jgi:hypothetical protein
MLAGFSPTRLLGRETGAGLEEAGA